MGGDPFAWVDWNWIKIQFYDNPRFRDLPSELLLREEARFWQRRQLSAGEQLEVLPLKG